MWIWTRWIDSVVNQFFLFFSFFDSEKIWNIWKFSNGIHGVNWRFATEKIIQVEVPTLFSRKKKISLPTTISSHCCLLHSTSTSKTRWSWNSSLKTVSLKVDIRYAHRKNIYKKIFFSFQFQFRYLMVISIFQFPFRISFILKFWIEHYRINNFKSNT